VRVLFGAPVGTGHLLPLVPTARAAVRAGHDVVFAATGANLALLARQGFPVVDIAPDGTAEAAFRRLNARTQVPGLPPADLLAHAADGWAEIGELVLDGMLDAVERLRADVVVYEPYHVAGLVSAVLSGVPAVLHGTGLPMRTFRPALERMPRGFSQAEPTAAITVCPSSFTTPRRDRGLPMRYTPSDVEAAMPSWAAASPARPRVCVTFGSVLAVPGLLRAAVEGLRDLPVEVVLSTGGAEVAGLPENAHAASWLPLSRLMPGCAVVVHHGGSGTTFGALAAGVPQVVVPHGADQPVNAAAVTARGAGVQVDAASAGAASIREAVREVLDTPSYRVAARELAEENAARPGAAQVLQEIAALVRGRSAGRRAGLSRARYE
jgi:UDP:flavonoid glycosyltransferase YjiC (YdhE family)